VAITLWGRHSSCNVQKVMWALDELNLRYDHVRVGGPFGGLDTPAYAALNPNRKVPTLRDGGCVVWESHAIVRYLAAQYSARGLWPNDPARRATVDQWTDWTATTFQPAWISLFWRVVRTPAEQHDQAAIAEALQTTNAALAIMDRRLGEMPYLGGEQLSYADIAAGVAMYRWITMPIERPAVANVEAWFKRLTDRPPYRRTVCVTYADLVGRLDF
jgi:glutathione S-transferase